MLSKIMKRGSLIIIGYVLRRNESNCSLFRRNYSKYYKIQSFYTPPTTINNWTVGLRNDDNPAVGGRGLSSSSLNLEDACRDKGFRNEGDKVFEEEIKNKSEDEIDVEIEGKRSEADKRFVVSPVNSRLLKVAVVGVPNAGKSTLINSIMDLGVCPVSRRVHTTRTNQKAIFLNNEAQIVFIDTPGLVNMKDIKKFAFPKDFVYGPEKSIGLADVVAVIHDVANSISRNKLDPRIRDILKKFPEKDSILVLNKVDTIKSKNVLLDTVRILCGGIVGGKPIKIKKSHANIKRMPESQEDKVYDTEYILNKARAKLNAKIGGIDPLTGASKLTSLQKFAFTDEELAEGLHLNGWSNFHDVFMISALRGDGVDLLKEYFVANSKSSPWMFNEDFLTDIQPTELAVRIIKSKLLDQLPQEIPYQLHPKIEYWDQKATGELRIIILLECQNERYKSRVFGSGGGVINQISQECESILISLLQVPVHLSIKPYLRGKSN